MRLPRALPLAVLALGVAVAGCGGPSATPTPVATGTPSAAPSIAASPAESGPPAPSSAPTVAPAATPGVTRAPGPFTLTSSAFGNGDAIPQRFTCDGDDVSPPLAWTGAPSGAVTLALLVRDPDAGGFVHWVVYDLPATSTGELPGNWSASADAAPQGRNDFGVVGYGGPCPPSGTHRYVFRLLALDVRPDLPAHPTAQQVLDAAAGHTQGEAKLMGTYRR